MIIKRRFYHFLAQKVYEFIRDVERVGGGGVLRIDGKRK